MHLKPYKSFFFFVDRNTNRILPFSKPIPRIEFEQRRILGLQFVRQARDFLFAFACRKRTRCTRSDFPICANWRLCILTKSNMKTLRKNCRSIAPLTSTTALPPVQSILTEPDCFEGLLFRLWFWYDITYYVELSLFQKRLPTHKRGGYNYNVKSDITKNLLWMSTLVFPIQHCIGVENTDNIIFDHCS